MAPWLFLANLVVALAVFLPFSGTEFWGAKRWINIKGIILQPSEFLKITTILYLASWLKKKMGYPEIGLDLPKTKTKYHNILKEIYLPFLLFLMVLFFIFYFQSDISTLGIIFAILLVIYFAAGTPFWHTVSVILGGVIALFFLIKKAPYRVSRLIAFLNPNFDPLGISFQVKQSEIAVGSGGIFGQGLGMSFQKFSLLPQTISDATFAVFAEETGFVGCLILISLFLIFLVAGFVIAINSNEKFSQLVALGITFWIIFQGFVNISSTIGIFPFMGIPLPFVGYGGSHLIAELIGVGILLNIARQTKN